MKTSVNSGCPKSAQVAVRKICTLTFLAVLVDAYTLTLPAWRCCTGRAGPGRPGYGGGLTSSTTTRQHLPRTPPPAELRERKHREFRERPHGYMGRRLLMFTASPWGNMLDPLNGFDDQRSTTGELQCRERHFQCALARYRRHLVRVEVAGLMAPAHRWVQQELSVCLALGLRVLQGEQIGVVADFDIE